MKVILKTVLLLLLINCDISAADNNTPFDGTWERVKNEITRWKFSGNTYEVYWELEGESGEHYYKGSFTYKELAAGRGVITFEQTHSSVTGDIWVEAKETEITSYKFIDGDELEIMSARYKKK
jgi:hypothetical protein